MSFNNIAEFLYLERIENITQKEKKKTISNMKLLASGLSSCIIIYSCSL